MKKFFLKFNILILILFVIIGIISGAVLSVAYFSQGSTLTPKKIEITGSGPSIISGTLGMTGDLRTNSNLIVNNGSINIGTSATTGIKLNVDNKLVVITDGYVGIGIAVPSAVLDVAGKFKVDILGNITEGTWEGNPIYSSKLPSLVSYLGPKVTDSYINNYITASNYLPLIGGTITGDLILSDSTKKLDVVANYIEFGTGNIQLKYKTGSSCNKAILARKYSAQTATCSTGTEYNGCLACTGTNITCTAEAHWDGKAATTCIASHTCYGFTAESCPLIGCSWGGTCDQSSGSKTVSCTATHPRTSVAEVICLD